MVSVALPYYSLHSAAQSKWTATQEKSLSREYPFVDLHLETPEQYIQRTYLQFLWLPESIMPLNLLVPSMLRVNMPSSSEPVLVPHPLHTLLDQLLLSVRLSRDKYRTELPQILMDGGGAGETEENMMWFAVNYEKADIDDDRTRLNASKHIEDPWVDEEWRKRWLERMEKREVQIQILLHFLKMSLPGPLPEPEDESEHLITSPSKKRRRRKPDPKVAIQKTEERLESFMDKLSTWQLLGDLDTSTTGRSNQSASTGPSKDTRDWMQAFCEDLVEPAFKSKVPKLCSLLRTKVFPDSPFSDASSSDSSSRSTSPVAIDDEDLALQVPQKRRRSSSGASNQSRYPSPAMSTTSIAPKRAVDRIVSTSLARSRSRSLSVSLAQDANSRRAGSVGVGAVAKKRSLNREVSMSRVFKEKPAKDVGEGKKANAKRLKATSSANLEGNLKAKADEGVTLVQATPVKGKKRPTQYTSGLQAMMKLSRSPTPSNALSRMEEEDWSLASSPDVQLLVVDKDEIDEDDASPFGPPGRVLAADTPVKKGQGRR